MAVNHHAELYNSVGSTFTRERTFIVNEVTLKLIGLPDELHKAVDAVRLVCDECGENCCRHWRDVYSGKNPSDDTYILGSLLAELDHSKHLQVGFLLVRDNIPVLLEFRRNSDDPDDTLWLVFMTKSREAGMSISNQVRHYAVDSLTQITSDEVYETVELILETPVARIIQGVDGFQFLFQQLDDWMMANVAGSVCDNIHHKGVGKIKNPRDCMTMLARHMCEFCMRKVEENQVATEKAEQMAVESESIIVDGQTVFIKGSGPIPPPGALGLDVAGRPVYCDPKSGRVSYDPPGNGSPYSSLPLGVLRQIKELQEQRLSVQITTHGDMTTVSYQNALGYSEHKTVKGRVTNSAFKLPEPSGGILQGAFPVPMPKQSVPGREVSSGAYMKPKVTVAFPKLKFPSEQERRFRDQMNIYASFGVRTEIYEEMDTGDRIFKYTNIKTGYVEKHVLTQYTIQQKMTEDGYMDLPTPSNTVLDDGEIPF